MEIFNFLISIFQPLGLEAHSAHFLPDHQVLLWFIVWSNALIAVSYLFIPAVTLYIVRKRRDLVFNWVFLFVGALILTCGLSHIMHIIIFWYPLYKLQAAIEALTAVTSIITFFAILYIIPKVIKLSVPKQFEEVGKKLENEIRIQKEYEQDLLRTNEKIKKTIVEIEDKNNQLARLNNLMNGRELRLTELRKELEKKETYDRAHS